MQENTPSRRNVEKVCFLAFVEILVLITVVLAIFGQVLAAYCFHAFAFAVVSGFILTLKDGSVPTAAAVLLVSLLPDIVLFFWTASVLSAGFLDVLVTVFLLFWLVCFFVIPRLVVPQLQNCSCNREHEFYFIFASLEFLISIAAFALTVWLLQCDGGVFRWDLASLSIIAAVEVFLCVYMYVRKITSSNRTFFGSIFQMNGGKQVFDFVPVSPTRETSRTFLLECLLMPSFHIARIKESISPLVGAYRIDTEYDVEVPAHLAGSVVAFPIVLQRKGELTSELQLLDVEGTPIRRLCAAETRERIVEAVFCMINTQDGVSPVISRSAVEEAIGFIMGSDGDGGGCSDREHSKMSQEKLANLGISGKFLDLLTKMAVEFRYLYPICIEFKLPSMKSSCKATDKLHFVASASRSVPLLPIRNPGKGPYQFLRKGVLRWFTKKRMRYSFGLGNADRAKSYHLTFEGPEGTYFADAGMDYIDLEYGFALADQFTVTSRYDQQRSRLYIKNGRGFSGAAVVMHYEERTHRTAQVLCAFSMLCLMLLTYFFVASFQDIDYQYSFADLSLFLSIMTFAGVMSVWQAMSGYRAEEWVWLTAAVAAVVSLTAFIYLTVTSAGLSFSPASVPRCWVWTAILSVSYADVLFSFASLFEQVKQHGALMYKVPHTRSLGERGNFQEDASALIKAARMRNKLPCKYNDCVLTQSQKVKSVERGDSKRQRFESHARTYKGLVGDHWGDGWLIPTWASLLNPYAALSDDFLNYAEEHLRD